MADKEQTAIMRLQTASAMSLQYYGQPLVVTTSGGKDSRVCVELAIRAGISFEVMHSHTTADAPETAFSFSTPRPTQRTGGANET